MTYEKTTWQTGDIITAGKMNKIENELETLNNEKIDKNYDNTNAGKYLKINENGSVEPSELNTSISLTPVTNGATISVTNDQGTNSVTIHDGVATDQQIDAAVTDWLNENVTPIGSTAIVDSSLSVSGAAADAKVIGDEIADLKTDLNAMSTATSEDISKALLAKTVENGKVTEWEFGKVGGDVETADVEINLNDIAGSVITHTYTLLSLDGTVSTGTLEIQKVREFAIPSGYKYLRFTAQSRNTSESQWVLYNAETFENCSPSTMIKSGRYKVVSSSDPINIVELTDDCKMLLVISRDDMGMCSLYNTITVEKSLINFAGPFDRMKVYEIDEYCIYEGYLHKRKLYTGIPEDWISENWEKVSYTSERQVSENFLKYSSFVTGRLNTTTGAIITGYNAVSKDIFYIDRDIILEKASPLGNVEVWYYSDKYDASIKGHTDANYTGWNYIRKGSYIRILISTPSGMSTRKDAINDIVKLLTFKSVYGEKVDDINACIDEHEDTEVLKMYQKGASPKLMNLAPCILVAGQSNIDGRVPKTSLPAELNVALPNIMNGSTDGSFTPQGTPGNSVGIDWPLFFALNGVGGTFYKIKHALGATAISPLGSTRCWTPFYEQLNNINNSLLLEFDKKIKKCLETNQNTFDIRAFVWQQGEGDFVAQNGLPRMWKADAEYYHNFKCLVAYVRGVTGNTRLPVVCGTVSHRSGQYDPVIEAATLKVAEEDPYMICIDMSGAKLLDAYHFNAEAAVYFGYKAFDALIDLGVITAEKINPTRPWEEYTITYVLDNCYTNSYDWDTIRYDGQSLTRKVFAKPGYTLGSVTVIMGDTDITETAYSNGTVTISDVQGNITITATATKN